MKAYLDASGIAAPLVPDGLSVRAEALLRSRSPTLLVSGFAAAEFASAVARRVRVAGSTVDQPRAAFADFDAWALRRTRRIEATAADVRAAEAFLRRLDLTLRTPDALNIAIAQRSAAHGRGACDLRREDGSGSA